MKFNDLSPELQEKAAACNTLQEFLALIENEGYELSDQDLEDIAGGSFFDTVASQFVVPLYVEFASD